MFDFGYNFPEVKMWEAYKVENEFKITEFYSAFVRMMSSDYVFQGETHDFWEMVYVIDGNAIISADDRVINLTKNQIIFHKPMEFHTLRPAGNKDAVFFIISFSAKGKFMENFVNKILFLQPEQTKELMSILDYLESSNNIPLEKAFPVSYLYKFKTDKKYAQKLKNLTENFLISIADSEFNPNYIETNETKIYRNAINIIENSLDETLSVPSLASKCNVSIAYLKKIFSKYTGLGIHEYILTSKITLAKQMLLSGSSVTEISEKLAFSSQNYFSVVFRRKTVFSPTEYKKAVLFKN